MIRIVKASAGSGKTFSLTRQYISLLLKKYVDGHDPFPYRHILAVTFTNAATAEMKNRILKELHLLAENPEESDYRNDFVPAIVTDLPTLQDASRRILHDILHDYGMFSVSTIDSFFQQTLRAFSREIGQFASYQIELDVKSVLDETVDALLDALTEDDRQTLGWLTDSAMERVEQGESYNIEWGLRDMAVRLKSEAHRVKIEESGLNEDRIYSKENLSAIGHECRTFADAFEQAVMAAAKQVRASIEAAGLSDSDFSNARSFPSPVSSYVELPHGKEVPLPSATFLRRAGNTSEWFRKADADRLLSRTGDIEKAMNRFCGLFGRDYRIYRTVRLIRSQIYNLGLTGELFRSYNSVLREKNILCISDTNLILKDIIAGSDAPFVYEKTGVRYDNFLLDEFQDTSVIQWENFEPLLRESEANGNENFIVGDVKQSIYRWRDSDWNLLEHQLQERFPNSEPSTLDTNYRSLGNIVRFNNAFFIEVAAQLDVKLQREGFVSRIYSDVKQKCNADIRAGIADGDGGSGDGGDRGFVSMSFCDKDYELQKILDAVREVTDSGGKESDIAVLVRMNDDGAKVAKFLIEKGVNVVTEESLKVRSSLTVGRLVSLMATIDNSGNSVGSYLASSLGIDTSFEYQSLVELCEELIRGLKEYDSKQDHPIFEGELAYVDAFVDIVADYANAHGNSLHGFLSYWKDKDAKISTPGGGDAVRVLTVHCAKGLDFPYVIFPFAERVGLFRSGRHWCVPEKDEALDPAVCDCVYNVYLSDRSLQTLFDKDYVEELGKQYVDNINLLYVALTRAAKGMYIIAETPTKDVLAYSGGPWPKFSRFSHALYLFAAAGGAGLQPYVAADDPDAAGEEAPEFCQTFRVGRMPVLDHGKVDSEITDIAAHYPSWPVNPVEGHKRLILSSEYSDFFSSDEDQVTVAGGKREPGHSARLRGIVLHDILADVKYPEDLDAAVERAVMDGEIPEGEAPEVKAFLAGRIASAVKRGWFHAGSQVRNEVDMIDTDAQVYRPDRVEIRPDGSVTVIDYKFGARRPAYLRQIARYADIWRRLGYGNVSACLWYVYEDEVVS